MKSQLLELPDECICMILSCLRPSQVRRVALTFNKRLSKFAKPLLPPLGKIYRDEAHFEALFGKMRLDHCCSNTIEKSIFEGLNFMGVPVSLPSNISRHLEYLDLKDDLSWLERFPGLEPEPDEGLVNLDDDNEELDKLIKTTEVLGLTLPRSFVKLLKNKTLLEKLPDSSHHVELFPLLKIRKQLKDDATRYEDGYIFTWLEDSQCTSEVSMYLDTAGRHAILSDGPAMSREENEGWKEEWLDLTDVEKREGITAIASDMVDFMLEDIDFERWLVNEYFNGEVVALASNLKKDGGKSEQTPEHVTKHFYNVFTEKGRAMQ